MVSILMNNAARISSGLRAVLAFHQYAVWSIILPHTLRKLPLWTLIAGFKTPSDAFKDDIER